MKTRIVCLVLALAMALMPLALAESGEAQPSDSEREWGFIDRIGLGNPVVIAAEYLRQYGLQARFGQFDDAPAPLLNLLHGIWGYRLTGKLDVPGLPGALLASAGLDSEGGGIAESTLDGSCQSARVDGRSVRVLLPDGALIDTDSQLVRRFVLPSVISPNTGSQFSQEDRARLKAALLRSLEGEDALKAIAKYALDGGGVPADASFTKQQLVPVLHTMMDRLETDPDVLLIGQVIWRNALSQGEAGSVEEILKMLFDMARQALDEQPDAEPMALSLSMASGVLGLDFSAPVADPRDIYSSMEDAYKPKHLIHLRFQPDRSLELTLRTTLNYTSNNIDARWSKAEDGSEKTRYEMAVGANVITLDLDTTGDRWSGRLQLADAFQQYRDSGMDAGSWPSPTMPTVDVTGSGNQDSLTAEGNLSIPDLGDYALRASARPDGSGYAVDLTATPLAEGVPATSPALGIEGRYEKDGTLTYTAKLDLEAGAQRVLRLNLKGNDRITDGEGGWTLNQHLNVSGELPDLGKFTGSADLLHELGPGLIPTAPARDEP